MQGEPGPHAVDRGSSAGTTQILLVWPSWRSRDPRGGAGGETRGWPAGMGSTLRFERSRVSAHLLPLKRMVDGKGSEAASAACPHPWVLAAARSARCRALL